MRILIVVCLVAFGFGIGVAVGALVQKSADKKVCDACWNNMCSHAFTITLNGKDIKVLPVYRIKRKGETMLSQKELRNRFTYHDPKDRQSERYEHLRNSGRMLAEYINEECPDSREKSIALTKVEEAIMWANASIARNE